MVLTFDTQQIYRSLSSKGTFSDAQAQTLTDALRDVASLNIEHLASKNDLEQAEERVDTQIALVRNDINQLEERLDRRIEQLDEYIHDRFELIDARFQAIEQRLTIKLGGIMVVGLGLIVALQQILGS